MIAPLAGAAPAARNPLPTPGEPATTREPVTLRLVWQAAEAEHTFAVRGPVFQEKFPNVKLQVEPSSDYLVMLGVLFSSNALGDVMLLESGDEGSFGFWASQGMLTQLDPFIKRDRFDTNVFFPKAIEALNTVDGRIWAFPYKAFMARCGLFYDTPPFQQGGVPLPKDDWTYDDMARAARRRPRPRIRPPGVRFGRGPDRPAPAGRVLRPRSAHRAPRHTLQ